MGVEREGVTTEAKRTNVAMRSACIVCHRKGAWLELGRLNAERLMRRFGL
jgi:hypothetical protein